MRFEVLLMTIAVRVAALPLPDFFPFGPNFGDQALLHGNEESVTVALQQTFPFYGERRGFITVQTDGRLDLRTDELFNSVSASVYVFSADVDTQNLGQVFYRETSDTELLQTAQDVIASVFTPVSPPSSLFIATWFYVGYFDSNDDKANTFQCVLSTDGNTSFAFLLYADDMIEWTTGDADGGVNGLGGDPADVGFVNDSGSNSFIPYSNTNDILLIDTASNVGIPGVWVFQIHGNSIVNPVLDECALDIHNCDPNAVCVDGSVGFLCICSPRFTGDGFMCTELDGENFSGLGSDMDNVTFPMDDITIGFLSSYYTVSEDAGFIVISVGASGFVPGVPREVYAVMYTSDGTAQGITDFENTIQVPSFDTDGIQNITIQILDDTVVENSEYFTAHLATTLDFVQVTLNHTTVIIQDDNDTISVTFQETSYTVQEISEVLNVCMTVTGLLERNITITVSTFDGTTIADDDYVALSQPLEFSTVPEQLCVAINIVSDAVVENAEIFFINLSTFNSAVDITQDISSVTILDDTVITIGFVPEMYTANESDGHINVCVEQTAVGVTLDRTVLFTLTTMDAGEAVAGEDYVAVSSLELFYENSFINQSLCVFITILDDTVSENRECFYSVINSDDRAVVLSPPMAQVCINDNDPATAPRNLRVVAGGVGQRQLLLEWDLPEIPNGIIEQYRIYYTGLKTSNSSFRDEGDIFTLDASRTVTLTGLIPDTSYTITVAAINRAGEGNQSTAITQKTDTAPPDIVIPPTVSEEQMARERTITIKLSRPDDTNGPLSHYHIVAILLQGSNAVADLNHPDSDYTTLESLQEFSYSDIQCDNPNGPNTYIAAEFSDRDFPSNGLYVIGDENQPNDRRENYSNGPLCSAQIYIFFLRVYSTVNRAARETEGVQRQYSLFTSSDYTEPFITAVLTTAPFQLRLLPIDSCAAWVIDSPDLKFQQITSAVVSVVDMMCSCGFTQANIQNMEFSCRSSETSVVFRAEIAFASFIYTADELLEFISQWVQSSPSIVVGAARLDLDINCPAQLDSFLSEDCVPTDRGEMQSSDSTIVIIGAALGSVCGVLIVTIVVILVCHRREIRKHIRPIEGMPSQHQGADFVCQLHPVYDVFVNSTEVSTFVHENIHCENEEEHNRPPEGTECPQEQTPAHENEEHIYVEEMDFFRSADSNNPVHGHAIEETFYEFIPHPDGN